MKKVIITADDFGLAVPVNEAIEKAYSEGVLNTASLMMGAPASEDAIARAKKLPGLKIGLHLVVVQGNPVLPSEDIPDIVNQQGEFYKNLFIAGVRFFIYPNARKQLEKEIRAQFNAFKATGLELDHVNTHNHLHLHPTIMKIIIKVGREYGMKAVRFPNEPNHFLFLKMWLALLKMKILKSGLKCNQFTFGIRNSGHMTEKTVLEILSKLPEGVSEIYFHPSTCRCAEIDKTMPDYEHEEEFKTLLSHRVKEALLQLGIERMTFSSLCRNDSNSKAD